MARNTSEMLIVEAKVSHIEIGIMKYADVADLDLIKEFTMNQEFSAAATMTNIATFFL